MRCSLTLTERVNLEIRENQLSAHDWELHYLAVELQWWVDAFNVLFFPRQPVPLPVLTFESARINSLGHYRIGRNEWSVRNQINLNQKHLNRPLWELLSTLLHEMVHAWEYQYLPAKERTKSWYHTRTFRDLMKQFGIHCNEKGQHVGLCMTGPFVYHLKRHGVRFDGLRQRSAGVRGNIVDINPGTDKKKGSSKLKKWSCGCTNIRSAVQVQAVCEACGQRFERQD